MLRELKGPQIEDVPHADVIGPVGVLRGRTRRRPRELAQRDRVRLVRGVAGRCGRGPHADPAWHAHTPHGELDRAARPRSRARWCGRGAHRAGTAGKEAALYRIRLAERTGRFGKR